MKLVAHDVKNPFCFSRFGGVMGSGLLSPLICFTISKYFQYFSWYPFCKRQGMLLEYAYATIQNNT